MNANDFVGEFKTFCLFKCGYPVDLAFCFELCQKSFTRVNNVTNWLVWLLLTFARQLVLTAWKHATKWLQNLHMQTFDVLFSSMLPQDWLESVLNFRAYISANEKQWHHKSPPSWLSLKQQHHSESCVNLISREQTQFKRKKAYKVVNNILYIVNYSPIE